MLARYTMLARFVRFTRFAMLARFGRFARFATTIRKAALGALQSAWGSENIPWSIS